MEYEGRRSLSRFKRIRASFVLCACWVRERCGMGRENHLLVGTVMNRHSAELRA